MTQEEKKKLLNALKLIREECTKYENESCNNCPLCSDEGCNLRNRPREWRLITEKDKIWRAFNY